MGMALPALMSIQFASNSTLNKQGLEWAQALVTADGMRLAQGIGTVMPQVLWFFALMAGIAVMLPSQMSIVDDFSRRWTDAIWTGNKTVRETYQPNQVRWIYYGIVGGYVLWSLVCATLFTLYGSPKLMTIIIANLNNVAIGVTAIQLLWINHVLLPREIRPRWYNSLGLIACAAFYLGLSVLVFVEKQLPAIMAFIRQSS